jgi:hypothetical protein
VIIAGKWGNGKWGNRGSREVGKWGSGKLGKRGSGEAGLGRMGGRLVRVALRIVIETGREKAGNMVSIRKEICYAK